MEGTFYVPHKMVTFPDGDIRLVPSIDRKIVLIAPDGSLKFGDIQDSVLFNTAQKLPDRLAHTFDHHLKDEGEEILMKLGCTAQRAKEIFTKRAKPVPLHGVFGY